MLDKKKKVLAYDFFLPALEKKSVTFFFKKNGGSSFFSGLGDRIKA